MDFDTTGMLKRSLKADERQRRVSGMYRASTYIHRCMIFLSGIYEHRLLDGFCIIMASIVYPVFIDYFPCATKYNLTAII